MDAVLKQLERLTELQRAENDVLGAISTFLNRIADAAPVQQVTYVNGAAAAAHVSYATEPAPAAARAAPAAARTAHAAPAEEDLVPLGVPRPKPKLASVGKRKAAAAAVAEPAAKVSRQEADVAVATSAAGRFAKKADEAMSTYLERVFTDAYEEAAHARAAPGVGMMVAAVADARPELEDFVGGVVALVRAATRHGCSCVLDIAALCNVVSALVNKSGGAARVARCMIHKVHNVVARRAGSVANAERLHETCLALAATGSAYAETCCFDIFRAAAALAAEVDREKATPQRFEHFSTHAAALAAGLCGFLEVPATLPASRLWVLAAALVYADLQRVLEESKGVAKAAAPAWTERWIARAAALLPAVDPTVFNSEYMTKIAWGRMVSKGGRKASIDEVMVVMLFAARAGEGYVAKLVAGDDRLSGALARDKNLPHEDRVVSTAVASLLLCTAAAAPTPAVHALTQATVLACDAAAWSPQGRAAAAAALACSAPPSATSEAFYFTHLGAPLTQFTAAADPAAAPVWVGALAAGAQKAVTPQ
eukprot:TRINITY_DN29752_c0_g1_i1.p1 TRINITY_DN29752_c0_g1~~TRINITY_DN29752_c0_g1_i1.p1  ORF type:complete len:539 (+),score=173.41 TRINITY_DN29752_c0_g1_i1:135-1751(+)